VRPTSCAGTSPPTGRRRVMTSHATTKNTFTVDGFVAGAWRIEKKKLVLDPFAPLPLRARREVDQEGARLVSFYAS
jgi:hypothetical protein